MKPTVRHLRLGEMPPTIGGYSIPPRFSGMRNTITGSNSVTAGNNSLRSNSRPIIVVHAGCGSPVKFSDGTREAARLALLALKKTKSPLKAAVRGVMSMEDDPRFNAGTGANLRIDGKTIEMDASVMDSAGNFGAVANIQLVKNPVLVAELVSHSPHLFICGQGAIEFARAHGIPYHDPTTPKAIKHFKDVQRKLLAKKVSTWADKWKNPKYFSMAQHKEATDTVGVIVSDGKGHFAAACSTGGISYMIKGRVGDTPIIGSGLWVGEKGAVVATGIGEEIMRRLLSRRVYDKICEGMTPQEACEWGTTLFKKQGNKTIDPRKRTPVGIIAATATDYGIVSTHQMATGVYHYKEMKIR